MKVEKLGEGEAEYAVVGSLHGDEPCGKRAIERFLSEDWSVKKPVKFIVANEEALEKGKRFLNDDINRSFPGDSESDSYEKRLAARIMDEIRETKVIDLHSTRSQDEPFATVSRVDDDTLSLLQSTGLKKAVYFPDDSGSLNGQVTSVTAESGRQGTTQAAQNAYNILVNFLAAEGVIDAEFERSEPELFEYYETVEGGDLEFAAENFQLVEKGEVFAYQGDHPVKAEEDFYPVLMSTHGYEDILGYKARKIEKDRI